MKSLSNGHRYGFDNQGNRICLGARMGRRDSLPDQPSPEKLSMTRLRWVDGDYDEQGAYWGHSPGTWIYWARSYGDGETEVFVRAHSRDEAKAKVRAKVPGARFFN